MIGWCPKHRTQTPVLVFVLLTVYSTQVNLKPWWQTTVLSNCFLTAFCCRLVFIHAHLFSCTLISINRNEGMPPVLVLKTSSTSMAVTLSLAIMTVLRASLEGNRKQHKTRGSLLAGFLNNTTKKKRGRLQGEKGEYAAHKINTSKRVLLNF